MAGVDVEELDNGLRVKRARYRKHDYVITELPYVEYEKLRKKSFTGADETYDGDAHNAFLVGKCVTEDGHKISAEQLYERGTGVVNQILRDIGTVHFTEEETDESEDDGEGEAKSGSTSAKAK